MANYRLEEKIEKHELNIVLVGSFNPVILTPFWLSQKGLIRESDAMKASNLTRIIHSEIVDYDLEWASFNITQKRFQLKCTQEPYFELTRDLVVGIFSILKETPITALGINHNKHITLGNETRFYEFGNKLCPLNNWSDYLTNPRLERLEILDKGSQLKPSGNLQIAVYAIFDPEISYGVGINVNDHYDFSIEKDEVFKAGFILEQWENSLLMANNVIRNISDKLQL